MGKKSYANDRRRLNRALAKAGIKFEYHRLYDGYQWTFADYPGDIVIHYFSYGNSRGHFESMGMPWDDHDCTEVTAKEIVDRLLLRE